MEEEMTVDKLVESWKEQGNVLHVPKQHWYGSDLELSEPSQNSIEIGESSKGELYLKSLKLCFTSSHDDVAEVIDKLFAMYDRIRQEINARKG